MLQGMCDIGNIVFVVEYDEDMMCVVDWIVDFGLGVGEYGGDVVVVGNYDELCVDEKLLMG